MLNILFPNICWEKIECVCVDLDGTIYDEYEFIDQVYEKIASEFADEIKKELSGFLKLRWLQKGSSYPKIFKEAENKFQLTGLESKALEIFRNYKPEIKLSGRAKFILNELKNNVPLMLLITDGKEILQNNKVRSLGINYFFNEIIVTKNFPKPSQFYGSYLIKKYNLKNNRVVFLGDREADRAFSENCGFQFLKSELWNYKYIN